jgi:hypothetical protein
VAAAAIMPSYISTPDMIPVAAPSAKPRAPLSDNLKGAILLGVVIAVLAALFYVGGMLFNGGGTDDRLGALRAYDQCLVANRANESACDELARAAGENPVPQQTPGNPVEVPIGAPAATPDSVVAGSR